MNLLIKWEDGSRTYNPLDIIAEDNPLSCALYAKEKGLLDKPGWKRFKAIARQEKKLTWMINQATRKSFCEALKFMFGYQKPRTPEEALEFDKKNGNTKWADAIKLETNHLFKYKTFVDYKKGARSTKGEPEDQTSLGLCCQARRASQGKMHRRKTSHAAFGGERLLRSRLYDGTTSQDLSG